MNPLTKRNVAKIEVQKSFCKRCQLKIKEELQRIEHVAHVNLYPEHALVVFSFFKANELAIALNKLSELGYPEIGEIPSMIKNKEYAPCYCY